MLSKYKNTNKRNLPKYHQTFIEDIGTCPLMIDASMARMSLMSTNVQIQIDFIHFHWLYQTFTNLLYTACLWKIYLCTGLLSFSGQKLLPVKSLVLSQSSFWLSILEKNFIYSFLNLRTMPMYLRILQSLVFLSVFALCILLSD